MYSKEDCLKKKTYYEQLCANRFDGLDEMDEILDREEPYKLPQGEIDKMNSITKLKQNKLGMKKKNYPDKKAQAKMASLANSAKYVRKNQ